MLLYLIIAYFNEALLERSNIIGFFEVSPILAINYGRSELPEKYGFSSV
jgi:hypothetical protein